MKLKLRHRCKRCKALKTSIIGLDTCILGYKHVERWNGTEPKEPCPKPRTMWGLNKLYKERNK